MLRYKYVEFRSLLRYKYVEFRSLLRCPSLAGNLRKAWDDG